MKNWKGRILCIVMAGLLAVGPGMSASGAYGADTATGTGTLKSSGISYEGENNVMERDDYAEMGLVLNSPEEFDKNDTSHPLEGYEPVYISELYVGDMNRTTKYKGSFRVMNDVTSLSGDSLNFNSMDDNLVGNEVSFNNFYEANKDPIEVQTNNTCAIDYDGDGTDEILNMTLYVDRDQSKCSFMDLRVFDLESGSWNAGSKKTYRLSKKDNDCKDFVWEITADTSKSYTSMTAGDFDGDGKEEGAVYVASKEIGDAYISIVEVDTNKNLTQKAAINVSQLNSGSNKFNMSYNDWYLPVVSLATTSISGQDDLVINISNPRCGDSDDIGHTSAMGIYHWDGSKMVERYADKNMVYGGNRIRFASATDSDINGNGVKELLVGGNINNDWDDNEDKGSISESKNYLQVITWNPKTHTYEKVWDTPKTVSSHGDLKVSEAMNEPVALAAAKIKSTSDKDFVFLEGRLFGFSGDSQDGAVEKELLQSGEFYEELKIGLGGDNSAFISTAQAGMFSTANGFAEQIVILAGDHRSTNNDNMYYDVIWIWESGGKVQSKVTNNDYFDLRNEDDHGTFMSICAMDVDQDSVYVEYQGKEYGWSSPELFTILQSTPYWKELDYDGRPGSTTFSISYGTGTGIDSDWAIQLGVSFNASLMAGVGCVGNNLLNGMSIGISALAGYAGERSTMLTKTDTWEHTVQSGEDYAIIFAVPVVDYQYKIWVPETKVTTEYIAEYEETYGTECPHKEGEYIGGEMEDCSISTTLDPTFSAITLEQYNSFVAAHPESGLEQVTEADLESKIIGDPTTYPKNQEELLSQVDEVEDTFHKGKYSANINAGDGSTSLSYEIEDSEATGHGFHVDVDFHIGWAAEIEASFLFAEKASWTLEGVLSAGGGAVWVKSYSKGIGFTTTYTDLPPGTDDAYNYNVVHGIYQLEVPSGIDEIEGYDHPYVVSYIVSGTDETTAPPKVPSDILVFDTTDDAILLLWKEQGYRPADSYNVYIKDNLGNAKLLGNTEEHYYWAGGLDANQEYSLAVQAVTGDRESVLSRWLKGNTESSDAKADKLPYFVTEPASTHYSVDEAGTKTEGITLKAEAKTDVTGAKISYQWQKLVENKKSGTSYWEDIEGATGKTYQLPSVPGEIGETYYRVIATQQKDSNYKSIVSRAAVIMVTEEHIDVKAHETKAQLSMDAMKGDNGAYYLTSDVDSISFTVDVAPKADGDPVVSSGVVRLYLLTKDGEEVTLGTGNIKDGKVEILAEGVELEKGEYRVYAAFMGGKKMMEKDAETGIVDLHIFLPVNSEEAQLSVGDLYDITYEMNGGVNGSANPGWISSNSGKLVLEKATRSGYTFGGWYWDDRFTKRVEGGILNGADLDGDITLYAKWTKIQNDQPMNSIGDTDDNDQEGLLNGSESEDVHGADDGDAATADKEQQKPADASEKDAPDTGDPQLLLLWIVLAGCSVAWIRKLKN